MKGSPHQFWADPREEERGREKKPGEGGRVLGLENGLPLAPPHFPLDPSFILS